MIYGNLEGVKKTFLEELEKVYKVRVLKDEICSKEIISIISSVSDLIKREISVAIDRRGKVLSVSIGDATSVQIESIDVREKRLSGVRIIHTHPNGLSNFSALDLNALTKLKLDAIVAVGVYNGLIIDYSLAMISIENDLLGYNEKNNINIDEMLSINILNEIKEIEFILKSGEITEDDNEKAIIVGSDTKESLVELAELASACEIPVLDNVFQSRSKIDPAFYIGKGKVLEIAHLRQLKKANIIIFDDELSGSQVRNLENALGAKVIDRTTLILEIFARRAKSRESKIQVELAQLKYRMSRLQGLGTILSRTGGGIGTRGPGEKKLETDRRHIKERIYDLNDELKKIKKIRETQREKRQKESIPKVSLVGYTNAGKSTLRNSLCNLAAQKESQNKEHVFEADMLFATLDITTRAIVLKNKGIITLTDTVGFVRKLPHDLVEAFKSTLEEVIYSDLLCHVVDSSSENAIDEINAVEEVLCELGAKDKETLLVLNKIDLATDEQKDKIYEKFSEYRCIEISAKKDINLDELLSLIEITLPFKLKKCEYLIPYHKSEIASYLHRNARVIEENYKDEGTYVIAEVDDECYNKTQEFITSIMK